MEQQFIAVTEKAPHLTDLEASSAKTFLREFASYKNRIEDVASVVSMRRCLEADDLVELLEASEGVVLVERPAAPVGVAAALAAEEAPGAQEEEEVQEDRVVPELLFGSDVDEEPEIVEVSNAPSLAAVHMVRKDNSVSGYRFCVDFSETSKSVTILGSSIVHNMLEFTVILQRRNKKAPRHRSLFVERFECKLR